MDYLERLDILESDVQDDNVFDEHEPERQTALAIITALKAALNNFSR